MGSDQTVGDFAFDAAWDRRLGGAPSRMMLEEVESCPCGWSATYCHACGWSVLGAEEVHDA